jgi:hypothetical protein
VWNHPGANEGRCVANVFISYARRDRERVVALAAALEAQGLSVWWDPNLVPGRKFRHMIAEQLAAADSVVVVWTSASLESDWVQDEAEEARQRGVLIPVKMEPVQAPAGFRQVQAADLSQWTGSPEHPEFRSLIHAARSLVDLARAEGVAAHPPGAVVAAPAAPAPVASPPLTPAPPHASPGPAGPLARLGEHAFDLFSHPTGWMALAALSVAAGFLAEVAVGVFAGASVAVTGLLAGAARRAGVGPATKNVAIGLCWPGAVMLIWSVKGALGFDLGMLAASSWIFTVALIGLCIRAVSRKPAPIS